jgi:hypothetical protein
MNVQTLPALSRRASTRCAGRYHQLVLSAARTSPCLLPTNLPAQEWLDTTVGDRTTCLVLFQAIFRRRRFNLALARSRMARFVDVSMGITPRNVRSEGVAPCKYQRLPNT